MRITMLVSILALAVIFGPANAMAQSREAVDQIAETVDPPAKLATLGHVDAVPMASAELDEVKGLHVHFVNPAGKFKLAGNPDNNGIGTGNWYLNGSPDGDPVAPSYHGLCKAPPIVIPFNPLNGSQCP